MTTVEVFAPAKINLTLHVTGQRADGYHLIDSLVVFANLGDKLTLQRADRASFHATGPFGAHVPNGAENLVAKALAASANTPPLAATLEKHLPPASGIGGGSADAAAALRGASAFIVAPEAPTMASRDVALALGADVPMCLQSAACRVAGIGEQISRVSDLPELPAVLVNPLGAVATPEVFAALEARNNRPMAEALPTFSGVPPFAEWLGAQRNDLETPAIGILPDIREVLDELRASPGALMARMSGSGATCFGLYPDAGAADRAAERLRSDHPDWWVVSSMLGDRRDQARPVIRSDGGA